jgi:hypothetical protein
MPMVGGKEYPYTMKGKAAAKKAAVAIKTGSKKKKTFKPTPLPAKPSNNPRLRKAKFSGVKSQVYGG